MACFARIMVLAVFAMGYNLLYGYVGLLSLGHAMFFSAGLYGAGLAMQHFGWGVPAGFVAGVAAGALLGADHRRAGAADHRRRLHDRHHDVRASVLPDDALLRRLDARRRGFRAAAADARRSRSAISASTSAIPSTRYWAALALFSIVLFATAGDRPLAAWPRAGGDPRERGAHADAGLRHIRQQARALSSCQAPSARQRAPAMPCCSAMSARPSPRCSIRSCRCCGCCSAAPRRRSGRSSARCSCTMWSTSPAASPRPTC